ncbi:hypothetical protein QA612_03685 [Evansella sp. AB-P1]|uniref:hypothetical protein n=1 Tax=Evansella sp. AB-P1 TaxID=3037653 RepID=UPI00241D96C8|nr:hypothetical protein [Evansella sp. AB-P1]MDG5786580.1 hypothetical protein [Evansella sp. AB-P1]
MTEKELDDLVDDLSKSKIDLREFVMNSLEISEKIKRLHSFIENLQSAHFV